VTAGQLGYPKAAGRDRQQGVKRAVCTQVSRTPPTLGVALHVPIVPTSVNAPVAESMLYMETSFEAEFVT
jgi:hypothetical protein